MKRNILTLVSILGFVLMACNLPTAAATETQEPATEDPNQNVQPNQDTAVATATATTAPAEVSDKVIVSVSLATNCRTGPDAAYQLLMTVQPGSEFEVVGKYTPKTYWIINMPTGSTCWLWGQYALTKGDTAKLPEIAAPAPPPVAQSSNSNSNDSGNSNNSNNSNDSNNSNNSDNSNSNDTQKILPPPPLPPAPNAPTGLDITRQCQDTTKPGDLFPTYKMTVQFTWSDASDNETGFNITKDGTFFTTLPANSQKFTETFTQILPQSPSITYGVQAVGPSGASSVQSATVKYCP